MLGAAAPAALDARLDLLQREDHRVATVFWRLATAGQGLCRGRAPQPGLVVHHAGQYGAAARTAAARYFGLGDTAALLAVVAGGAADRAGLRAGDHLISIGDQPLFAESARARIAEALHRGPASLTINRGGERRTVTLGNDSGCAGRIQLVPGSALDARAGEGLVTITTALVEFAGSDDELAFLIGHELAHVAMIAGKGASAEGAADGIGLRLAALAGYDPGVAAPLVVRLAQARGQGGRIDLAHPAVSARARALGRLAQSLSPTGMTR